MMDDKSVTYYDECPVCDTRFIGATAADMVEHIASEHRSHVSATRQLLGIDMRSYSVTCDECGRKYVSYGDADCPWCRNEDD